MFKFQYEYFPELDRHVCIKKNRKLNPENIHKKIQEALEQYNVLDNKWNEYCLQFPTDYAILIDKDYPPVYLRYKDRIILSNVEYAEKIYKLEVKEEVDWINRLNLLKDELYDIGYTIGFYKGLFLCSLKDRLEDPHEAWIKGKMSGRIFVESTYYDIFVRKSNIDGYFWEIDWRTKTSFEIRV